MKNHINPKIHIKSNLLSGKRKCFVTFANFQKSIWLICVGTPKHFQFGFSRFSYYKIFHGWADKKIVIYIVVPLVNEASYSAYKK